MVLIGFYLCKKSRKQNKALEDNKLYNYLQVVTKWLNAYKAIYGSMYIKI